MFSLKKKEKLFAPVILTASSSLSCFAAKLELLEKFLNSCQTYSRYLCLLSIFPLIFLALFFSLISIFFSFFPCVLYLGICYLPSFSLYLFCLSLLFFYFLLFFRLLSIFRLEDVGRMLPSAMSLVAPVKQYTLTFMRTLLAGAGPRHLSCAIATFARGCAPGAATKLLGSGRSRVGLDELAKAVYDEKYSEGALNQVMSHLFLRLP